MEIFVCLDLQGEDIACLRHLAGRDRLHLRACLADDAPLDPAFAGCEVCLGNPPANWLGSAPALRWVQLESVGFGEYLALDWPALASRLTITNLAGFFGEPVAETALAGILALCRGIDRLTIAREASTWLGDSLRPRLRTLQGASVLLLGKGATNRRLAELLAPFGCGIVAAGREQSGDDLDAALAAADIVVSAMPDTPATRGILDRRRIGAMRQGAMLVNLGRGSVLDEEALADALDAGLLAGAVIDVTRQEPLPAGHRFWRCPNLVLTQHTGGGSHDETARKIGRFAENLARYRAKQPLIGEIDLEKGY